MKYKPYARARTALTLLRLLAQELSEGSGESTVVSLSNHAYFNLNGAQADVTKHELTMPNAATIVAVDEHLVSSCVW